MDYDALVPKETSPVKKFVTYGFLGAVGIFLIITAILAFLNGSKYGHTGNYIAVIGLILFAVTSFLLYAWIPQDSVDDRVKYTIFGQVGILILLAIGVLVMTYQTTPCPVCPKPVDQCKELLTKTASTSINNWFSAPVCFDEAELKQKAFVCISKDKTCVSTDWFEYSF